MFECESLFCYVLSFLWVLLLIYSIITFIIFILIYQNAKKHYKIYKNKLDAIIFGINRKAEWNKFNYFIQTTYTLKLMFLGFNKKILDEEFNELFMYNKIRKKGDLKFLKLLDKFKIIYRINSLIAFIFLLAFCFMILLSLGLFWRSFR